MTSAAGNRPSLVAPQLRAALAMGASHLPPSIQHYLVRSLPEGPSPRQIRITQRGQMWKTPTARPMPFTATQRFAVERIAFSWNARFPMLGPLAINVVDEYADGHGRLVARLLGYPLVRQQDRDTAIGEAIRYLAELPLVPWAMLDNPELEWLSLGDRAVEVAAVVRGERLAVRFGLDDAGDIATATCAARPYLHDGKAEPMPWGGEFQRYESFGGIRVPTQAEVYWDLPEGRFIYWRGTVTSVAALHEPFEESR